MHATLPAARRCRAFRVGLAGAVLTIVTALTACGAGADSQSGEPETPTTPGPASPDVATGGGTAAGGTRPAAISPAEALTYDEPMPLVVEGVLFAQDDTWRLCGSLMESFPPQCSPADSVVITNPDAIPAEDVDAMREAPETSVRWGQAQVTYAGERRGADGLEITGPADAGGEGMVGGDAVDPQQSSGSRG